MKSIEVKTFQFSIKEIKNFFLDLLFPKYCVNCGLEGETVCFSCTQKIIPVVSQICPECHKLSERGEYHKKCSKDNPLKGIICASYFEEGPIREMIHNFKYNGVVELGESLAELMVKALKENFKIQISNYKSISKLKTSKFDIGNWEFVITFVPLHWRRQAQRGYNQSEILAKIISEKLSVVCCQLLVKLRSTKRQAELTGSNRRKNLERVFSAKTDIDIKNKRIIIVDDVTTTGSTLNECAKALKDAGAKEVWGLVVARG